MNGHGFIAATNINVEGKRKVILARAIVTAPSS
jgi:hypothetical protein